MLEIPKFFEQYLLNNISKNESLKLFDWLVENRNKLKDEAIITLLIDIVALKLQTIII